MHVHEIPPKLDCIKFNGSKLVPTSNFKIYVLEVGINWKRAKFVYMRIIISVYVPVCGSHFVCHLRKSSYM